MLKCEVCNKEIASAKGLSHHLFSMHGVEDMDPKKASRKEKDRLKKELKRKAASSAPDEDEDLEDVKEMDNSQSQREEILNDGTIRLFLVIPQYWVLDNPEAVALCQVKDKWDTEYPCRTCITPFVHMDDLRQRYEYRTESSMYDWSHA